MIRTLTALLLFAGPAAAGCANFTDGSMRSAAPEYEICYAGSCDVVSLEWECANVTSATAQWTGGWARRCVPDAPCEWTWQDRLIAPDRAARISVRALQ